MAAAQLRILKVPGTSRGIAYITCGPMWQRREEERNPENLRQIIRALMLEYVEGRSLFLRIIPYIIDNGSNEISSIFEEEGLKRRRDVPPYRTFVIDLSQSLQELNRRLKKKWRENLRRAERSGLKLIEGMDGRLYEVFIGLYKEMLARKRFATFSDVSEFRAIQRDLPDGLKMKIMICEFKGGPVSALVWSAIGDTGITILSATGNQGLKLRGSYLLRWRMLEQLKEHGCSLLDQGGVDREKNPGGYHFKSGMGGFEVCHIGQFEACHNLLNSILIRTSDVLMPEYKKVKVMLRKGVNLFFNS